MAKPPIELLDDEEDSDQDKPIQKKAFQPPEKQKPTINKAQVEGPS